MQKKLLLFLAVLVVGLLIANVVVLSIGLTRLVDKKTSPAAETSQPPAAPAVQIKQGTLNHSFVALPSGVSKPFAAAQNNNEESIGAQAGRAAGELQQQTEKSYEALNQQAQQTAAQLEKTSEEAMKVLNEQTEQTVQNLQVVWADILQKFNVELERFNEELKKKQSQTT